MDLSHLYHLRNQFTIIGLTGQIGSGCSEVAEQLSRGFRFCDFEDPLEVGLDKITMKFKHNSYRKYRIVYNYAKHKGNFTGYSRINYKDVLMIFILKYSFYDFINFLKSSALSDELKLVNLPWDFSTEIELLKESQQKFEGLSERIQTCNINLSEFFFNSEFLQFCNSVFTIIKSQSQLKRNKLLQIISTNLRKSGNPFEFSEPKSDFVFTIVKLIDQIIESQKNSFNSKKDKLQIVIDDLRSPIEIMYFKQKYAAFYTIAVTKEDESRKKALKEKYNKTLDDFNIGEKLWEQEYEGGKDHEFYKEKIKSCIQQADIHISFLTKKEADEKNRDIEEMKTYYEKSNFVDNTSPYHSWKMELLKYVSLISHPGLITPSPEERCMQMAYTAKHNSGCISRHVGAAVTDENYSVKAIGWNDTPSGQVPCSLRNTEDILGTKNDLVSFTNYEKRTTAFFNALDKIYREKIKENGKNLEGRNVSYCFKDIKNSYADGKNQVHTRSLHAEESAFLQLAKYGSNGIENGKLFTTASPCELCAKKAYQIGIRVIYYIDPYPGISNEHILSAGDKPIKPRLFSGVIGNAYHWLYDPIMPHKDELTLLLSNKFDDYATKQEKIAKELDIKNKELQKQYAVLVLENLKLRKENDELKKE